MSSKKGTAQAAKWAVNPVVLGVAFILSFYVGGVYFFHSTRSAEVAGVGSTILSVEAPHDPSLQRVHTSVASKHSHGRGRRTDGTVGGGAVGGKAVGKHGKTVSVWSAAEVSLDDRKKAAEELVRRVVGEKSAQAFKIEVVEKLPEAQDFFEIKETGATGDTGVILLRGSSGVAVASALNWYLRYDAHVDTSWNTPFPVSLQSPPPMPKKFTRRRAMVKWGYYENVCTFSYSQAWWQWERWEKEIDWMAMSGINLPLALTGQEYILHKVFTKLGLSQAVIDTFFTGPAFLAWNRMLNIKEWEGPLSMSWIQGQKNLQIKILDRERSLGMTPVLPAFAGGVPDEFSDKYPDVELKHHGNWGGFPEAKCCVSFISPTNKMFKEIGQMFISELRGVYGSDHYYSCDTFNENRPSASQGVGGLGYLTAASHAVFEAMRASDPDAVWFMQGWLFFNDKRYWKAPQLEAYLDGVPHGRLVILDLFTEVHPVWKRKDLARPTAIEKRPWIWNMLHSFGGNSGMYGRMHVISSDPVIAHQESQAMSGVGITTEGIEQNPAVYELMAEMRWHEAPIDPSTWLSLWAHRRLGPNASPARLEEARKAWDVIGKTVYSCPTLQMGQPKSMIECRPRMDLYTGYIANSDFMPIRRHYPDCKLVEAWKHLRAATLADSRGDDSYEPTPAALFDLVDVTRQVMSDAFARHFVNLVGYSQAHETNVLSRTHTNNLPAGNLKTYQDAVDRMELLQGIIMDLDKLMATQPLTLLGKWITDARAWGENEEESDALEANARNLLTLWGPRGEISDYASRQWSGLISGYYLPRWELFFKHLESVLKGGYTFDQANFARELLGFEQGWQDSKQADVDDEPAKPLGDARKIVEEIVAKYEKHIVETCAEDIYAEPLPPSPHSTGANPLEDQLAGRQR